MNKRIKQLSEQAGFQLDELPDSVFIPLDKFAELIIRECASLVDNHGRWILYDKLAVKIKQHFGVAE